MTRSALDVEAVLSGLRQAPGVYRMYDDADRLIYVGKARNVRRRVGSYFGKRPASPKVGAMLRHLARVEVTWTRNEVEALLLESTLIKRHRPRYNVVLRDDKSYPYIRLEAEQGFPRLAFYRGTRRTPGRLFGPYPSAGAARSTLAELQRVFRLRNCTDTFFRNRARPCLQYQIERCSAPCLGLIGADDYGRDVEHAVAFLEGRDERVIEELIVRMEQASSELQFERAARLRDQIQRLRQIRARQDVVTRVGDCDVLAVASAGSTAVVTILPVRGGRVLGTPTYRLAAGAGQDMAAILETFIAQHYLETSPPPRLVPDRTLAGAATLGKALATKTGRPVLIRTGSRGALRRLTALARTNARQALALRGSEAEMSRSRFTALERVLGLAEGELDRIECFDVSHTGGEAATGSCVVFDRQGPLKQAYRRFRVRAAAPGDDYAALAEVLERRYRRLLEEGGERPTLVLVDGGPAQVRRAHQVLQRLGLSELQLAGVTKGAGRRPSLDRLVVAPAGRTLPLSSDSPALHLVQALRDEAHRFAITGHRKARARARGESALDDVPGIGPVRRRQLLTRFGGLRGLRRASVVDLATVPGVSRALAERIAHRLGDEP